MQSIDSQLSQCLEAWPSDRQFSVDDLLAEHPEFANDSVAIEQLVLEEYIRRLETGERINPSLYCERFSSLSPEVIRQLRNLADLHSRHGLFSDNIGKTWEFPEPGDAINGYTLVEEIGRGAFSRVFLAKDGHVANRQVVVKTTYHGCAEIELLGPLSHPHLPRIFYCGRDPDTNITTICMDWIGQRSLYDLITEIHFPKEGTRPSPRRAVSRVIQVIREVADGLAYAHDHNVLHLDVKPSNILLRDDGTAVLIDFNLAITASESRDVGFRGTLAYAAPEVIATAVSGGNLSETVTEAADVYSLGTVFYELLTGTLPCPEVPSGPIEEAARAALAAKQKPVPRPSDFNPAVDSELDQIILKALSPHPEDRYLNGQQFHAALRAYSSPTRKPSLQRSIIVALSACVIVVTVFFSGSPGTVSPVPSVEARLHRTGVQTPHLPDHVIPERAPSISTVEQELIRGWKHLFANEPDAALNVFERAQAVVPDPRLEVSTAYALMMQGQIAESRKSLFKLVQDPLRNDMGVRCGFAYSCLTTDDQIGAGARALSHVLDHFSDHELALFLGALFEVQTSGSMMSVSTLKGLNTDSSRLFVRAIEDYRNSRNPELIDETLTSVVQASSDAGIGPMVGVLLALQPDFVRRLNPNLAIQSGQ